MAQIGRAGEYRDLEEGYRAYVPRSLPPDPPLSLAPEQWADLSRAEGALARLDERVARLHLPDAVLSWMGRREALASARLDGVPIRVTELLEHRRSAAAEHGERRRSAGRGRARADGAPRARAAAAVMKAEHATAEHCRRARRKTPRVSMLRELQVALFGATTRADSSWRDDEIWIGPRGSTIRTARYVPVPPRLLGAAVADLDRYLQSSPEHAALVRASLIYHQIETLQPFSVGSGRVNRVFACLLLASSGVEAAPVLGLSRYFLRDPGKYLARLQGVREAGEWESWLGYYLQGLAWTAEQMGDDLQRVADLREHHRSMIHSEMPASLEPAEVLLRFMLDHPVVSVSEVAAAVDRTFANANQLVGRLEDLGLLKEVTGQQRNRRYLYEEYVRILRR